MANPRPSGGRRARSDLPYRRKARLVSTLQRREQDVVKYSTVGPKSKLDIALQEVNNIKEKLSRML